MPEKLPYEQFLKSFELCPRVCIEVVIRNDKGKILLIRREREPYKDFWHFPGGFILKDESFSECIKRIAKDEAGTDVVVFDEKFDIIENISGDPRGHLIHLVWQTVANCHTDENRGYFGTPPENMIPFQKDIWNKFLI